MEDKKTQSLKPKMPLKAEIPSTTTNLNLPPLKAPGGSPKPVQQPQGFKLEVPIEELRKRKLFVATPMYGGMCHGPYMKACLDLQGLCMANGIEIRFSFLFNESLITRARNYVVDEFLRSGMTHMIFIDSDVHFDPKNVLELLAMDREIIGAPYPKKSINWNNVAAAFAAAEKNGHDAPNPAMLETLVGDYVFNPVPGTKSFSVVEPLEVLEIGTGYMMIKREVFLKFKDAYPHLRYKPDHKGQANFDGSRYIHAYFDTVIDPVSHRYLSEDYMFCQYWRNIGGAIWLCPWMKTQHIGTYAFTGDMKSIAAMTGRL